MFGASKSLGVPTTDGIIQEGVGGKEKNEEQEREEKKDLSGSAVSRLRQMFERNKSDSKKRASLEARPLPRPITALAASSTGEHEVIEETAAAASVNTDATGDSVALDATAIAGVQVPAAGTKAVEVAPLVAWERTTGAGPAPFAASTKGVASWAVEERYGAVATAVGAVVRDDPSVPGQPALKSRPCDSAVRMDESSLVQAASYRKAPGVSVVSSPADVVVEEEQAPRGEEHVPTEGGAPVPAEETAATKVAEKKASKFGVSLQKLFFGSSKDAAALKASEPAVGGSMSLVHEGEKESSPAAGTEIFGALRDHHGDETQLVDGVTTQGGMNNPAILGASNYTFSGAAPGVDATPGIVEAGSTAPGSGEVPRPYPDDCIPEAGKHMISNLIVDGGGRAAGGDNAVVSVIPGALPDAIEPVAGDGNPATFEPLQADVEPVKPDEATKLEQHVPVIEGFEKRDVVVQGATAVLFALSDGSVSSSSDGEDVVIAVEDSPVDAERDWAAVVEGKEEDDTRGPLGKAKVKVAEPGEAQPSWVVAAGLPEGEPAAAIFEDPPAAAVSMVSAKRTRGLIKPVRSNFTFFPPYISVMSET